jgi:hypothetical protein
MTDLGGTCGQVDCPVRQGVPRCARGTDQPIHCEAFVPEPALATKHIDADDPQSREVPVPESEQSESLNEALAEQRAVDGTADTAPRSALSSRVPLAELLGTSANEERETALDVRVAGEGYEGLAAPTGPRNEVELADRSVSLRSMTSLDVDAAETLMAHEPTFLVLPIGAVGSGKTTLLSALFEQFHQGPTGQWKFAGSQTLLGFLQRSYYATMASGRSVPTTFRTRMGAIDAPWLHLAVAGRDGRRSLLLADISGEHFRDVAAGGDVGDVAPILRRADHILHLVDCSLFRDLPERQRAMTRICTLIRRMVEDSLFGADALHTIALTKCDTVDPAIQNEIVRGLEETVVILNGAAIIKTVARPGPTVERLGITDTLDAVLAVPARVGNGENGPVEDVQRGVRDLGTSMVPLNSLQFQLKAATSNE